MGVDVTHIIKNDYVDDGTRESRVKYCRETVELLREKLGIKRRIAVYYLDYDHNGVDVECRFRLPKPWDVEFFLHQGYWQIESYFHYCQIVIAWRGDFYLRDRIKKIALALGQNEVWHAEEYYTWNADFNMDDVVTEDWFEYITSKFPNGVAEFRADDWRNKVWGRDKDDYEPVYHDDLHNYEISNNEHPEISSREEFRIWLENNCKTARNCWIRVRLGSKQVKGVVNSIDAIEEALCYNWRDGGTRRSNGVLWQQFVPRTHQWSELIRIRYKRLYELGLLSDYAISQFNDISCLYYERPLDKQVIEIIQKNPLAWKNFQSFPILYQRISIDNVIKSPYARGENHYSNDKLKKLIAASEKGKMIGNWNDYGRLLDYQ